MKKSFMTSLFAAGTLAVVTAVAPTPAGAVGIPCGTAKLIVPWGAGGDTDILFRMFVDVANKTGTKPQIQVVNIGGQGGNKGAKEAREAKPDGCTLFAIHQSALLSYMTGRVDFTWDAFTPLALLSRTPAMVGANPKVPFNDMKGLVAAAKAAPESILAGGTFGSTSQFFFYLIEDAADIKLKHVPYEGTRERMTALLANNIQLGEINGAASKGYLDNGELKSLGFSTDKRVPQFPDIPTLKEQGIDVVYGTDRGIVGPKGMAKDVIAHYVDLFKKVSDDPAYAKAIDDKGSQVLFIAGDAYAKYFDEIFTKWKAISKKFGVYKAKD